MIKLILILFIYGSVPVSLLEELAEDAKSLSPILKVADLYLSAGMLDDLPLQLPIREARRISSPYGYRKDPFTGQRKYHSGIDYACDLATTVHATRLAVRSLLLGNRGGYGKCVEINHRTALALSTHIFPAITWGRGRMSQPAR